MDNQKIPVEKVTKPIQLLAAWLTGLILIDAAFLTAANTVTEPVWAKGALIIAAIINVPIFLFAIFLLQTKFRPEMQEDSFYSKYLESKTGIYRMPSSSDQTTKLREELLDSNVEILNIVRGVQGEISKIYENGVNNIDPSSVATKASEIEGTINKLASSLEWKHYEVRINNHLRDYSKFKLALINKDISISGVFGAKGGGFSDPPQIVIGSGFTIQHIRDFLNAINGLDVQVVAYAYPEDDDNPEAPDYSREILIGAYNDHDYGLSLSDAIELANKNQVDVETFYAAIG
ncbi:hypothetical protein [Shewanella mangrovisoli]|uniref:hypothetical protein n=1 Tax=Shewanella mangrovisoli TaxID=2864211 RepID=UPI0035B916D2